MSFEISKNGYHMYKPTWQQDPGSRMKQMNRAASDSYFANFSALGGNLLSASLDQSAGMIELTSKLVTTRLQADYSKKLEQARAGLDVIV
jgi:hypothetical protein